MAAPAVVVMLVVLALTSASGGGAAEEAAPAANLRVDRFDSERAFAELRRQVRMGPRPAGSAASRRLASRLRRALPDGRFESVPGGLRNVVGTLPGPSPAIVVAAHYDTKRLPGFVGANDGAGGTAAVLELARALGAASRPAGARELRFVLFDGEERTVDKRDFYKTGVRGSRAYAQRHRGEVGALVLLDFVADRRLRIPREEGSDIELWARLRAAARRVGAGAAFPDDPVSEVLDDHTPFTRAGIPAIDLIDFDFPCWHKRCDDMSAVSERSLDTSGEAVLELLRSWR
ncbi:MAG: M28 family metallopeptidase [Solirubrobacteraceae bacterium]